MGIILFLVDTSASMNQRTYLGASYLDVAKVAIETFMKYRSREPSSRSDRYMLVSFDEPPHCIKAGWKTTSSGFVSQLKGLQATSLSTFGRSLREAFNLLNVHRLHTGIDHYGQGRIPIYLESAVVVAITDGGKLTRQQCVEQQLSLVGDSAPQEGSELTNQPYRWDQRLFTILLRLPGIGEERNLTDLPGDSSYLLGEEALSAVSELTGGRSYVVTNQKSMVQCMESLSQKLQPGVVLNFQKIRGNSPLVEDQELMEVNGYPQNGRLPGGMLEDSHGSKLTPPLNGEGVARPGSGGTSWHNTRRMIYVKTGTTTPVWPLPESFWPDGAMLALPPRDVHPIVWFSTSDVSPMLVEKFPFDKYELEASPLTQYILARRNAGICWQVYIRNSGKQEGLTHAFGYLKASTSLTHVTLFVMPFNFPALLPLADELLSNRLRPNPHWKQKMTDYIATVPGYYAQPLRKAFHMMGAPQVVIPDSFEVQLSASINSYLRKLKKQAKLESERVVTLHTKLAEAARRPNSIVDLGDGISLAIGSTLKEDSLTCQSFRNPYDISRRGLLGQLSRMRSSFLRTASTLPKYIDEVLRHQVPIGQMGNYQEHLKKMSPLRELDDSGGLRTQLFGNPYKLERSTDKQAGVIADEHMVDTSRKSSPQAGGRRRALRTQFSRSPTPPPPPPPPSQPPTINAVAAVATMTAGGVTTSTTLLASSVVNSSSSSSTSLAQPTTVSNDVWSDKSSDGGLSKLPSTNQINREVGQQQSSGKSDLAKNSVPAEKVSPPSSSSSSSNSTPEPFKSSSLPDDKRNHHHMLSSSSLVLGRKRERSPSPTAHLNSKKASILTEGPSNQTAGVPVSQLLLSRGNSLGKTPSPTPSSLLGSVPAVSKVMKDGPVGVTSSASRVLTEEIMKQEGQENGKLKNLIVKEVRRPGQSFDAIFQHLENVRGSLETRDSFVGDIIKEAGKFKRKKLVQQLEGWRTNLKSGSMHVSSHPSKRIKVAPSLAAPLVKR